MLLLKQMLTRLLWRLRRQLMLLLWHLLQRLLPLRCLQWQQLQGYLQIVLLSGRGMGRGGLKRSTVLSGPYCLN